MARDQKTPASACFASSPVVLLFLLLLTPSCCFPPLPFPLLVPPVLFRTWGYLYESYGARAWFWEIEEMVRKVFLTCFVVLLDNTSPLQVTLAVLVSFGAQVCARACVLAV